MLERAGKRVPVAGVLGAALLMACGPRQTTIETEPGETDVPSGETVEGEVPEGTAVRLVLDQEISTDQSRPGDEFSATVDEPVRVDGEVVIPDGAVVTGEVTAVQESGDVSDAAVVKLAFHEISFDGREWPIEATIVDVEPETEGRGGALEDAAKIGGGTAAGAVIGAILGGGEGALVGAAVGAAAGTAIVLGTKDVDAVLPEGSPMTIRLDSTIDLTT